AETPYLAAVAQHPHCSIVPGEFFSSQVVQRAPIAPVVVSRNERERVLIEASVKFRRESALSFKQADDIEKMLLDRQGDLQRCAAGYQQPR
uniref:Glycosyltransferase n=1 Tax=Macrostomum lignano TaxID=282301 RepID=A0A1I8FLE5_9PLAT